MSNEKDSVREAAIQALNSRGITQESMSAEQYEAAIQEQMKAINVTSSMVRIAAGVQS